MREEKELPSKEEIGKASNVSNSELAMAETDLETKETSEKAKELVLSKAKKELLEGNNLFESHSSPHKDKENALNHYRKALEFFMIVLKAESNAEHEATLKETIESILSKTESIRKELNIPLPTPQSFTDQDIPLVLERMHDKKEVEGEEFVEFEVGINVERVKCYSILNHQRELIAEGSLQILKMKGGEKKEEHENDADSGKISLLKIGAFEFPLTKSIPCLGTARGNYIIPMSGSSFYGFVLPDEIPDAYINVFESLLKETCNLEKQSPAQESKSSQKVEEDLNSLSEKNSVALTSKDSNEMVVNGLETTANIIGVGAEYAVWGIQWGSKLIASGIHMGGQYLISNTQKAETAHKPIPAVAATINAATYISPYAVKVSRGLVTGMATAAETLGSAIGNQIFKKGDGEKGMFSGPKTEAAKHIGQTTLMAVSNIWEALEDAGQDLVVATSTTTSQFVDHKLGEEAAKLTEKSFGVALDSLHTAYNVKNLGIKKLAKRVAAETGKGAVISYAKTISSGSNNEVEMKTIKNS
eukprot:TRINITY_DN809_c0_g1_i1.p1 TRINITY_DN809_c0_g1~~TRINITY_DN809_c0_g1_i1.p1  ORF type:complete len:531 (-),score=206.27 TRINITY_DN809_c0_g1_i1:49-1641(-)